MTIEYQLLPLVQPLSFIDMLVPVCEDLSKSLKRGEQKEPLN